MSEPQNPRNDENAFWTIFGYLLSGLMIWGGIVTTIAAAMISPNGSCREIWPVNSSEEVGLKRPRPGVYPNPYRLADDYNTEGWEDPRRQGLDPERARRVTFTNIPDTCIIAIYSLDGDLVRRLEHRRDPWDSRASVEVWDLISRNTQAIKSGIYIYSVESRFGVDLGKLVIIK